MTDLRVSNEAGVLRLHIDREPKRNALNGEVLRGMLTALRDPGDARVVLVSSAGDRVFRSGADLVQMAPDATGLEVHEGRGLLREVVLAMRDSLRSRVDSTVRTRVARWAVRSWKAHCTMISVILSAT